MLRYARERDYKRKPRLVRIRWHCRCGHDNDWQWDILDAIGCEDIDTVLTCDGCEDHTTKTIVRGQDGAYYAVPPKREKYAVEPESQRQQETDGG